ncbi:MAG: single-stranded DNA-binding protein [Bdellovibrionales bacterium]|nr:single-stranded DNA-binding protein [Bdellovibrionales bacterium]
MANLNRVLLIGRLTRDPELRYTPNGSAVADFGLAVNKNWKDKDGQKQEEVCFIDIVVWGKSAENCHKYLDKGRMAFIEGRLKLDTWEKDGQKRSKLHVVADTVQFLDFKKDDQADGQGKNYSQREVDPEEEVQIPF